MGEVGNAIKLLTILQSKGQAKSDYLANRLEVSRRQIYRYIEQLQKSGIGIKSKRGRYGGFILDKNQFVNFNSIKKEDIELMELACQNLKGANFTHAGEVENTVEKLKAIVSFSNSDNDVLNEYKEYYFVKENPTNSNKVYLKKIFEDIRASINTREKIKILYNSNSSEKGYRKIHPYGIFSNWGDLYIVAYCEKRNSLRNFKINRILDYKILENETYKVEKKFDIKTYAEESFGVFKDDKIHFKLKIIHPFSIIIKEREHIKNEKITDIDEKTILYEAEAKGKTEIISWIISMENYCEIIEPEDLREEIRGILKKMIKIYE